MSFSTERTKKRSSSVTSSEKSWAVQMNEVRLKERRKLVRGFTDFLESSGRMESDMYEALKAACKGNERQSEVLVEPVKKYCQELRERFEELGGERWPLEIIGVMRENGVETVEELRELCEKGVEMVPGGIVENANKAQDELALLQDAWNEERETLFRELNKLKEEKRLAEEAVSKYKKTLKEEREASSELRGLLRKQENEPKKAGQARDTKEVPVPSRLEVVRKWSPRDSDDEFSMHGRRGDRKTVGERRDSGAKMKCFTCGGIGHGSWQCVSKRVDKVQIQEGTVRNAGVETVEMVEMLGQRRRVVIDSGAVVSVISTTAYERLKAGCRDWEKEVEVFGKPTFTVLNASNSKMRVRGQIKIPMVVRGRKVRVVFQLVDNWVERILIGTNAFESIGVELKWKDPYGLVNAEENSAEVQFSGGEKKLERPGEKLRKVPTEVSEIQCKSVAVRGERGRRASTGDVGEVFKSEGEEKERKKVKIRASVVVIGPRLEARGPGVLEYRNKTITGWTQKFDWGEVKEAVVLVEYTDKEDENSKRVEFVKSVAKEVEKVWMMPRSLQCELGDVDKVAKQWKEWLKTSANVEVVDPLMPVGNHKTPLILEKWHRKSLDGLQKYLHNALPSHSVRSQWEKNTDRRPQSGVKKDLGKGCPIAERRGKWLRRSSTFSKPHGITEVKGNEYSRGNRKT
ncbi:hypothetical protein CRE_24348 [Caenorhabditis remanei]|uniref:CCHC-type domain-containing protein n=1 Tax=Caenorhabditis remanei TaxID=31234 RepID=E3NTU4_CAERE|nr:hypothetical protein CRE_24348 [Caenorhabditis remanei]